MGQLRGSNSSASQTIRATPSLPDARGRRGVLPFVTVLCKFSDVAEEPESPAFFERLLGDSYPGLDDYWRTVSYGSISLTGSIVVGWYTMPHSSDAYRTRLRDAHTADSIVTADLQRLAEDCTAAADRPIDWARYYGINLVFNANLDRPRGGQVCMVLGGVDKCYGATWIWASMAGEQAIWAHEMGHSFGLRHSSLNPGTTNDNVWDVMSDRGACGFDREYHRIAQDPIAYDKDALGWIPADRKFVAAPDSETTITLERLAIPGPDGYLLAQIPIPGADPSAADAATHFHTVEARRPAGYDHSLPGEAVVIHEVDAERGSPARPVTVQHDSAGDMAGMSHSSDMWTPGSIFRNPEHGIAVAVEQATPTGFVVTITTRHLPWPLAPRDHALVPAGSIAFAWQPVPDADGYRLEITSVDEQRGATLVVETVASASYSADLAPGIYRWRVRSLSDEGAGSWTPSWELTVSHLRPAAGVEASPLDAQPPGARGRVAVAINGHGDTYAIWAALEEGSQAFTGQPTLGDAATDIYFSYRAAGGSWEPPVKVNDDPGVSHSSPAIATDGAGNAYAIWIASDGSGNTADIYFAYRPISTLEETESGWSASEWVNDVPGLAAFVSPSLAVDPQGNAFAAWIDSREGPAAVYFAHRLQGATEKWRANIRISGDSQASIFPPSIIADAQGNVYLAWQQARRCSGVDLYFVGRTAWGMWGAFTEITPNPTGLLLHGPSLVVDPSGVVHAVWQEEHGSLVELYAASCGLNCGLPVAGASALGNAIWLGRDTEPRRAPAAHIQVDERGSVCVAWPDATGQAGCLELSPAPVR